MKKIISIFICCCFLLIAGIFMAASTDIGDSSIECSEDQIFKVVNGVWECSQLTGYTPQYIFSHTDKTIPVNGVGEWTNITFDQENADIKYGISHNGMNLTNHTFMMMATGVYNMDFDIDLEDTSASATQIAIAGRAIYLNGTEIEGSVFEIDLSRKGAEAELSHNFLARLNAGTTVIFQFIASDADVQLSTHGTYGDHPESATIVIYKIANI